MMQRLPRVLLALMIACAAPAALGQEVSLDALLEKVKTGRVLDAEDNAARIAAFTANKAQQAKLLADAEIARGQAEARSKALEQAFDDNDLKVIELEAQVKERLGSLKELFGVLQQAAGDARGQFEASFTHVEFPDRIEFLNDLAQKMGQTSRLASLEEIERLWFELQREMTESGKVVRYAANVVTADGREVMRDVVRVGAFNVISQGKYLQFIPETGRLVELARQPQQRYLDKVAVLERSTSGTAPFGLDPSLGQILPLLVQAPSPRERIRQGGVVGYVIIGLGALGFLIAIERIIVLTLTGLRVRRQARNPDEPKDNALGRILKVYHDNPAADTETLELKLSEAILKETPRISRMLMFLKIIAVVAPLLGLLGTVTGMIITFQQITLFGTGDPKLMAGGISQALVTTVLGLCVAIPTVLMHTLVASRAKHLNHILEEQAAGMVAAQSERAHRPEAA